MGKHSKKDKKAVVAPVPALGMNTVLNSEMTGAIPALLPVNMTDDMLSEASDISKKKQ